MWVKLVLVKLRVKVKVSRESNRAAAEEAEADCKMGMVPHGATAIMDRKRSLFQVAISISRLLTRNSRKEGLRMGIVLIPKVKRVMSSSLRRLEREQHRLNNSTIVNPPSSITSPLT